MTRTPETYATCAKGIRVLPGQWRPHDPFEQIAWISPPWPSQEYVWLDFPEAIFCDAGLLYLSHVSPAFPALFPDLPAVPWKKDEDGINFERDLPNGVSFGGSIRADSDSSVRLELFIQNDSRQPLRNVKLQTCAYLRALKEFSDFTQANKLIHTKTDGWISLDAAIESGRDDGAYRVGWREGSRAADLPVAVALSSQDERLLAITWYEHTYSLIGNPEHPCLHADPDFPDIDVGKREHINGRLIFFEGGPSDFADWFVSQEEE